MCPVSHAFLHKSYNGIKEYIFDNVTWRSTVHYDAQRGNLNGADNAEEYDAQAMEEDDNDEWKTLRYT